MQYSIRIGKWLAAALIVLTPGLVDAAGLGKLTVQSALGQAFQAEIDLISVPKEELGSLSVRLASPAAYQQAGLQYNSIVAGLALRIERRPNGQPYIKVTSSRPVNEFVVDILIDLSWASGRIMREFRVLLDPPDASAPAVAESRPAPPPAQPSVQRAAPVEPAARASGDGAYGPVKRGETLSQIAREVRPDGVSVEQMLVGLYRSNPDAFIRKNMNLMRSGKILRVPERGEVEAISQAEAVKEYRAQVADWNSYRQRVAESAAPAPEGAPATRGKITARVDERAAGDTRDVVRLSKGEPPGSPTAGQAGEAGAKARIRALEEEIIAREKALKEANERVAQLEKTINDMQRLMEMKSAGMAAAQQKAEGAVRPEPAAKPPAQPVAQAPAPPEAAKPEAAKPEAAKPEAAAKPKPPVKPAAVPLPPEPSLAESLLSNPINLAGIALVLLGGIAFWVVRRRRADASRTASLLAPTSGSAGGAVLAPAAPAAAVAAAAPAVATPDVDPLEEARVYVLHGRDAQAEAILKDALAKTPRREGLHLKLLEIYAARQDKNQFAKYAADFQKVTRGDGENWIKVAAMGYALDAANPMYAAGKDLAAPAPVAEARSVDVDFDLDLTAPAPAQPQPEANVAAASPAATQVKDAPRVPDQQIATPPVAASAPAAAPDVAPLDFHIELPPAGGGAAGQPEPKPESAGGFKLPDIDLNLDDQPQSAANVAGSKDAHWYDVQAKFDLAKAYEEMGDKAGARQILQEVIREGDAEQQVQAKQLLSAIG
ncbi:MAG: FimV/HubP family polar landmark protein [Betaproteobacteria bacterium]